jgi:hypothetical protein
MSTFRLGTQALPIWSVTRVLVLTGLLITAALVLAGTFPQTIPADLGSFAWSAHEAAAHRPPYTGEPWSGLGVVNLNPPISLILFQPLRLLEPLTVARVWWALIPLQMAALLLVLARTGARVTPLRVAWVAASAGALWTLLGGQIYAMLGLLAALAWADTRAGRLGRASVWLALLAAVKPQFGLCIVLLLLAAPRSWRALLSAAGITVAAWGLPVVVYGPGVLAAWWAVTRVPWEGDQANAALSALLAGSAQDPAAFIWTGLGRSRPSCGPGADA